MVPHSPFGSPSFKHVAKGLVALHRLIKAGRDDSPEADVIRDALDAPLKALNPTEKERAQWLSEDLYSVSEPPQAATQRDLSSEGQRQLNEALEARQRGQWDRALELLRRWQEHISPALLSSLRGSVWLEAGNPDVAAAFFEYASESEPENANYRAMHLRSLAASDPEAARRLAGQRGGLAGES